MDQPRRRPTQPLSPQQTQQIASAAAALKGIPALQKIKDNLIPAATLPPPEPPAIDPNDDHDKLIGDDKAWEEGAIDIPPGSDTINTPTPDLTKINEPSQTYAPRPDLLAKYHPVLMELRKDFGLDAVKAIDVELAGHIWTMRVVPTALVGLAVSFSEGFSQSSIEYAMNLRLAMAACSIIAIDSVPTYIVFDVPIEPTMVIRDPLDPPYGIAYMAATRLIDFLHMENKRFTLGENLYDEYCLKLDQQSSISTLFKRRGFNDKRVRFRCPTPRCDQVYFELPEYIDNDPTKLKPLYCRRHGVIMEAVSDEVSETDTALG